MKIMKIAKLHVHVFVSSRLSFAVSFFLIDTLLDTYR